MSIHRHRVRLASSVRASPGRCGLPDPRTPDEPANRDPRPRTGAIYEQRACVGRNPERRVRSQRRRQARAVGGQRPALRRLGDLPPQRLARGPQPHLRVAIDRLAWADAAAVERRREDVGGRRQQVRLRRRPRHAPVVRRHAASLGIQAGLASRAVVDRSRHGLRGCGGRGAVPHHRRGPDVGRIAGPSRPRLRPALAAGRRRTVPAHHPDRSRQRRSHLRRDLRRRRVPHRRWREELAADQPRAEVASTSRIRRPRSATACTASRCIVHAPTCCSCRSTGT